MASKAKAIQIVTPTNHQFKLELQNLKEILEHEDIKNRHVVAVSIAGAFRKGKSFLLNFFLKYLYAKYKKHDASNWINEHNTKFQGFRSRGGHERETTGIWMWSDIFTHDFDNGDKVAIILLDTQGIFDDESTTKDCTATFAISMMLASVQCYNVMQNVQEDDLQHLQLFTEYGRLAMQQTNEKPFQHLLFIVRDWPYKHQFNFGDGQEFIEKKLRGNDKQTSEMKELRVGIDQNFVKTSAFLMAHPGLTVAEGEFTDGDVQQIDSRFIESVKELVPSLLAPENLIVKQINGQKVRVRDLIPYMQAYVDVFNSDTLPEPKSVLMATAETSNQILFDGCLKLYVDTMQAQIDQKSNDEFEPYFVKSDLKNIFEESKAMVLSQFQDARKLGGSEMIQTYEDKLEFSIQVHFDKWDEENDKKKIDFDIMAEQNIRILHGDCFKSYSDCMQKTVNETEPFVNFIRLHRLHKANEMASLSKFNGEKKLGNQQLILGFQQQLETDIANKYKDLQQQNNKKEEQFKALLAEKMRADAEAAKAEAEKEQRLKAEANTAKLHEEIKQLKINKKKAKKRRTKVLKKIGKVAVAGIVAGPAAAVVVGAAEASK